MMNCNSCKNLIPEDSEFCPFCGNKVVRNLVEHSDNVEPLHLYQPDALLKRAFLFLEEKLFDKADTYVEAVLNKEPENAEAYLAKLLVELRVSSIDELCDFVEPFDTNINYKRAIRYSNEKLKERLESAHKACVASIERRAEEERLRQEEERLFSVYSKAKYYMNQLTQSGYLNAAALFRSLNDYKDSAELAEKCLRLPEEMKLDEVYRSALSYMKIQSVSNQEKAIALFKTIPDWRDSQNLILRCEQCIEKIKAQKEAERIEKELQAEIERIEEEKKVARNRKIAMIVTPIAVAIIIFLIILKNVIIPSVKYNNALDLMNDKKYEEAIDVFEKLDGYKDSIEKIEECNLGIYGAELWDVIKNLNIGDIYTLGSYEQDNNTDNGKEKIEWQILDKEGSKIFVISKCALDAQPYDTSNAITTWETCSLRKWLNNDFLNSAFSIEENAMIQTSTVSADKNTSYGIGAGNATQDKLFLLSIVEVEKYFASDIARKCQATAYAKAQDAFLSNSNENCWWWLRTPGLEQYRAAGVDVYGNMSRFGATVDYARGAVRPAMWIDVDANNVALFLDSKYNTAVDLMNSKKYTEAISVFKEIETYKDSAQKIDECNESILEDKYDSAISLMEAGKYQEAIAIFNSISNYKDSKSKLEECNNLLIDQNYKHAIDLMDSAKYSEAVGVFKSLNGYKDSEERLIQCTKYDMVTELNAANIGNYIKFGKYNQFKYSGNYNTLSDIEWLVLDKKDNKILVTSRYALDCKKFNEKEEYTTWETCNIRSWLNDYFYNFAF